MKIASRLILAAWVVAFAFTMGTTTWSTGTPQDWVASCPMQSCSYADCTMCAELESNRVHREHGSVFANEVYYMEMQACRQCEAMPGCGFRCGED